jgi:hypothetical protein
MADHYCSPLCSNFTLWLYTSVMLLGADIARIKAEMERLEKLRTECTYRTILKRIDAWIEAEKKKLAEK